MGATLEVRPHVVRTTARPVSAMQRRRSPPSGDERKAGRWVVAGSRPSSASVLRGKIRPQSAMARASGMQTTVLSSDEDLDDTYSVASTRPGKPSRASSPSTYTSGYNSRPVSAMSRPVSALSRTSDVDTVQEDDEDGRGRRTVTRRYFTNDLKTVDGKARLSHFSVKMPMADPGTEGALEAADKTAHLRIYYGDMLGVEPAEPPVAKNERTIEVDKMAAWLSEAVPRSRIDAYPLLVLTRDILRRFVSKDLIVVSKEAKRLAASLDLTNKALKKTQLDLAKSQKEIKTRDTTIRQIQELADQLPGLQAELKDSQKKCQQCEAKIADLNKASEEQKTLFNKKLEETKAAIKEKCDMQNEKRMEALKNQAAEYQKKLEASKEDLKAAKAKQSQAERSLLKEKETFAKQLKDESERVLTAAEIIAVLEKADNQGMHQVLKVLMTSHRVGSASTSGSFLEDLVNVYSPAFSGGNDQTPLLHFVSSQPSLFANGAFNSSSYIQMSTEARWEMCMAMLLEQHYRITDPAPTNLLDALMVPAMRMAVGDETIMNLAGIERQAPQDPQLVLDLQKAKDHVATLTSDKEELQRTVKDLEAQLEDARKVPEPEPEAPVEVIKKKAPAPKAEDWSQLKRPKALSVFKIDPKMFKGKTPQPARVEQMLTMFANIYEGKASADNVDDRDGNTRQGFPDYMRDWMINKFGLKSIAMSNLCSVVMGIQARCEDKEAGSRIRLFGRVAGVIPHDCWHEDISNMILSAMGLLFQIEKISENMGHAAAKKPLVEAALVIEATAQAWAKYGFGKVPATLEDTIVQMSRREGGQVRLHEWLELLCDTWFSSAESMEKELRTIFTEHDENGDGVLDLGEFRGLLAALLQDSETPLDERQISRLFAEALEESSAMRIGDDADEDVMQPEAFIRVARRARLYNPAH